MTQQAHPRDGNIEGPSFFSATFDFSRYSPTLKVSESLNFSSVFKDGRSCSGNIHVTNCTLFPALLK
jgi:hypothetical protein